MLRSIKSILYVLSGSLLRLVLFFGITATVLLIIFGRPNALKTTLQTSNAYSRLVPSLIETSKKNGQNNGTLSFDDPVIAEIFTKSFPPADIKKNTELFIDSVYSWLNNKTDTLQFTIDFTSNKQLFARELANYAFNKLELLPYCKQPPAELDPLNATCLPKNVDLTEAKRSYEEQIFLTDSFLQKTILTQEDLPKNTKGQSITDQLYFAPDVFTWLKRAPFILSAFLIFLSFDFILLSPRKRKGVQSLSTILISSGVGILAFPLLFSYVLPYFSKSFDFNFDTAVGTQKIFTEIIDELSRNIDILFISFGAGVTIVGFMLYIGERLSRPQTKYTSLEKKSGLATSQQKAQTSPKSLRGKLNQSNIPLQTSDGPKKNKVTGKSKYRTLKNKKEF